MGLDVETRTRVFLSYSRKDIAFVTMLARDLSNSGLLPDFDQSASDPGNVVTGISAEDEWWARLKELIAAADVVVFVVSPASAASKVCEEEIALAQALSKRVICILYEPIDLRKAPPRLSALNIKISFVEDETSRYGDALSQLILALGSDVKWLRQASLITSAAMRWNLADRPLDLLFRGVELTNANDWASRRPTTAPEHSDLVLDFLASSRDAELLRVTLAQIERTRYVELRSVVRPFLEEEMRVRDDMPQSDHLGLETQRRKEVQALRALLENDIRWHPEPAIFLGTSSALDGYAGLFRFPCCDAKVMDVDCDENDPPSQFYVGGCQEIPKAIRHDEQEPLRAFRSRLIEDYRKLLKAGKI